MTNRPLSFRRYIGFFQGRQFLVALGAISLLGMVAASLALAAPKKDDDKVELTAEQKAEAREIRKAFAAAGKSLEKQQAAIDRAVEAGPHVAAPLVKSIEGKFKGELKKYKKSLAKAVGSLGAKRLVTSVDELMGANERLKEGRNALEQLSAMHVSLRSAVEGEDAVKKAAAEKEKAEEEAKKAKAEGKKSASKKRSRKRGKAKEKVYFPLFDQVPMMEFVALGIGAPGMSQREIDCVLWTNRYREKHGLRLLWADAKLSDSARMHSRDMVEHDFRAHESPLPGKKTFRDRGKIYNTRADGENIAEAPYSGEKIVEYWLDSPPHKANIVHPKFRRIGVGLHNDVWTQVFGGIDSFER